MDSSSNATDSADPLQIEFIELDGVKLEYIEVTPDIVCDITGENLECPNDSKEDIAAPPLFDSLDHYEFCQICLSPNERGHPCMSITKVCPLCYMDIFSSEEKIYQAVFKHMRIWHLELVEKYWVSCNNCSTYFPTADFLIDHADECHTSDINENFALKAFAEEDALYEYLPN